MYHRFHGCGYGYAADFPLPAALPTAPMSVSPTPSITPHPTQPSDITAPAVPGIAPGPAPSIPGVHHGMQYGMVCIPAAFYPFELG
jgi:hypothetical protein